MATGQHLPFGTLLRRYRLAASLTQEELAERAQVSRRSIGDLERGAAHRPRRDTVILLAEALALTAPDRTAFMEAARRLGPHARALPQSDPTSSPPLVGRVRELAMLERHLAGEGPPLLLLAGEPGIGKTRLLHAAVPRALALGLHVLEGGCQRREGQEPYAPLQGALHRYVRAQRPGLLRAELQGCPWLVRLLPELADGPIPPLPDWTVPPEQERRLMFDAVARFLTNVAGPRSLLLILDDLQWAGPDALDLLRMLVQTTPGLPIRLLGAYRNTEVRPGTTLSVLLADLAAAGLAAQRTLAPLDRAETAQLVDLLLKGVAGEGTALRDQIVQRSGGVPFFALSCAQELHSGERGGGEEQVSPASARTDLPWSVTQSIRQRVAVLQEPAQSLLGAAAVIGRVVSVGLLMASSAQSEADLLRGLEAACAARLLEETSAGAYQFVHDVIREVVEVDLGAARRLVLHRRVAAALEQQAGGEPPLERLAYHYAQSNLPEKAALYLELAGDWAGGQAGLAAATGYYQDAVQWLDGLARRSDASRVREKWGTALRAQDRYDEALVVLEGAAQTYTLMCDRESLGRVTAQIGQVLGDRGTPEEGVARVQSLVQQLEGDGPSPALAQLYTSLAWLLLNTGQYPAQLAAAERAVALAGAMRDDRVRAQAELWRAEALDSLHGRQEALAALETAAALAEANGDLHTLSYALPLIAEGYLERDAAEANRRAERALAVAEKYGNPVQLAWTLIMRGHWAVDLGNWSEARASFERALVLSRQVGGSFLTTYCLLGVGRLCVLEGRWTEAVAYLEESAMAATRTGNLHALRGAQKWLAECDLLGQHLEAARDRLLPLLDRPGLREPAVTELLPVLATALLELGDVEGADSLADRAVARARQRQARGLLVEPLRVQAMVRMRQEQWMAAEQILEEGLAVARQPPHYPHAEARLLEVYGRLHLDRGGVTAAGERWREALVVFQRLGARKDLERVEQELTTRA